MQNTLRELIKMLKGGGMKHHKRINMNQPIGSTTNFEITGRPREEEILQIKKGYILRLKHYTERVKNTVPNDIEHKMAVIALLGYLEALEFLTLPAKI